ncbi:Flp pilus assembly protein CpaB [Salinibacterium sp. SYSU T00001]|uniref:Flp pilus assembly protein CpaB n=1 Tax=Homoserinimonas sedimenticola TaxID=2986805 RepID=UPI00223582B6|nr:Flp pilus assembly protein CpaB [Salinibacterium sedimenticola]MCW4385430.1 Flp pilus assembly protein CpaB [Salinibacterium sedimenticola]
MFRNRLVAALLAVLLAVAGAALVFGYASSAERRALETVATEPVLVVQQLVPEGTPAGELAGLVAIEELPSLAIPEGAVRNVGELGDTVAAVDLLPGETVLEGRFVSATGDEQAEGLQLLSIPLDPAYAVGGNLAAGDRVGLFVTFTDGAGDAGPSSQLLIDGVPVSAVQGGITTDAEGAEVAAASTVVVTLAVTAEQARSIVFAREFGSVWLTKQPRDLDDPLEGELTREELEGAQ